VTQMLDADSVRPLITPRTSGILGVHLWGHACDPHALQTLADAHGLQLCFDACHGMGCSVSGISLAHFGRAAALSLHATKILNGAEGGCIATNDAALAAVMRDMRNFYSSESGAPEWRMNGKMSEAQAAMALLSLDDLAENLAANDTRYQAYAKGLAGIPGIKLMAHESGNNYQYIVLDIDAAVCGLHRDVLMDLLQAENIYCRRHFFPGVHRLAPYNLHDAQSGRAFPNTDRLCQRLLQLPTGQAISIDAVDRICRLLRGMIRLAPEINQRCEGRP
jgi:dTDP-4-amino-4,6-dideoxygalactose transaminase